MSSSSGFQPDAAGSAASGDAQDQGRLNLNFFKSLTDKKATKDGQPPKKRGPKPDTKPALTRRQELNRQAQRTHRERKELYIKALEDEVLRLKEVFANVSQDKEKLAEENRQLKTMLTQHGLSPTPTGALDDQMSNQSLGGYASSNSVSGSYVTGPSTAYTSPPPLSNPSQIMGSQQLQHHHQHSQSINQPQPLQNRVDYDQAGIDFVLTLEKPCMDHLPWLVDRAAETDGGPCGHALMASCPPEPFANLTNEIPFGFKYAQPVENQSGNRTWELSKGDLTTLLDLSKKLDLDGEITPVMAWGMIKGHPRLAELREEDFKKLMDELQGKVRCYGFGAVMEEFELRDALNAVFSTKPELNVSF
ncbi:hypothetical protein BX600DRAFT_453236 [Xylariales sp. PMI_506]|nr:hypothetical protein BX600DRAFT_453236 [Xylariales sp. PMI_506]